MIDAFPIIGGAILMAAAVLLFWVALPRQRQVRRWLRSDQLQAYFTITIIGMMVIGLINLGVGLADWFIPRR